MKELDELKKKVLEWTSGLPIEGETKEELKQGVQSRLWDLQCELDQQATIFEEEIDKLDIPEE